MISVFVPRGSHWGYQIKELVLGKSNGHGASIDDQTWLLFYQYHLRIENLSMLMDDLFS